MVSEIIGNYEMIVKNIGQLIEVAGYRNDYIAKKIGMTTVNFSAKKSRKTFSLDEIKKIVEIIDNEDVEDYLMLQEMRSRKDDESISHQEFYKLKGWS